MSNPRLTGLRDSIQLSGVRMPGEGRTLTDRAALFDLLAILTASLVVVACLFYAQVTGTYDATTFMVSVVLPLVLGSAILSVRKERILLFAFLAYLWAVVDDAPVFFDSVITWPEVTRFHPFLPRLFMNVVIHALTALFLYLTIRESMKGTSVGVRNAPRVVILTSVAFVLAYAQNIPLAAIQNVVETSWYPFDFTEKLVSIFFLYLALREATKLTVSPAGARIIGWSMLPHRQRLASTSQQLLLEAVGFKQQGIPLSVGGPICPSLRPTPT